MEQQLREVPERRMKIVHGTNQMSLIRDTEEVLKFLEFAGKKAILNNHAVNCRMTACNNLFSVLNEDEDNIDYILGNLDMLTHRFRNRNTNVRSSTLKVYKSRVKSCLEDYKAWSADPFAWERAVSDKAKASGLVSREERRENRKKQKPISEVSVEVVSEPVKPVTEPEPVKVISSRDHRKVSFPIRENFSVEMNIPVDGLTMKELQRLGLFLYPYCKDIEEGKSPWASLSH